MATIMYLALNLIQDLEHNTDLEAIFMYELLGLVNTLWTRTAHIVTEMWNASETEEEKRRATKPYCKARIHYYVYDSSGETDTATNIPLGIEYHGLGGCVGRQFPRGATEGEEDVHENKFITIKEVQQHL